MARRIVLAATLCALAAGLTAASASGHAANKRYESLVRGITPQIAGFSVEVLNGDDRLLVQNSSQSTITVEGYQREPYLSLRPDGRVAVNLRSPAYYLNQDRFYGAKVPDSAEPMAPPQWKVVERTGRYEFHDHRMHYMAKNVPKQVSDRSQRTKIFDWSVPLSAQGARGQIRGELFWRGEASGAPVGALISFGALLLIGIATVVVVRRRRRAPAQPKPAAARGEAW